LNRSPLEVIGYFENMRRKIHLAKTLRKYHHMVPKTPNTIKPLGKPDGRRTFSPISRKENGKSTTKRGNHHHEPSVG
jgi:hypothetical protein